MNDYMEGHGVHYYADGTKYEGDWVNGKMEGFGVEYNTDGTVNLKGEWKRGKLEYFSE